MRKLGLDAASALPGILHASKNLMLYVGGLAMAND